MKTRFANQLTLTYRKWSWVIWARFYHKTSLESETKARVSEMGCCCAYTLRSENMGIFAAQEVKDSDVPY